MHLVHIADGEMTLLTVKAIGVSGELDFMIMMETILDGEVCIKI